MAQIFDLFHAQVAQENRKATTYPAGVFTGKVIGKDKRREMVTVLLGEVEATLHKIMEIVLEEDHHLIEDLIN